MKICILSKYPPIQGGVSSDTYWLARELGQRGHEISIITNAWEVESEFRELISEDENRFIEPTNVKVFSTAPDFNSPILRSKYFCEKLLNLSINLIRKQEIDLIYSHYTLPYGIVGYLLKKITKVPHVLKCAGSDVGKLYYSKNLKTIFVEAFREADKVFGGGNVSKILKENKIETNKLHGVEQLINPEFFNPDVKPYDLSTYIDDPSIPIFTYFGKISRLKQTYSILKASEKIKKDFRLLFVVGEGQKVDELKKKAEMIGLSEECIFLPFQPPWKIPSLIRASTCVLCPESEESPYLPIGTHYPKIARESMACGVCTIIGKGVLKKGIYSTLRDNEDILIIDPRDIDGFSKKMEYVIDNPEIVKKLGKNAYHFSQKYERFKEYVDFIEKQFVQYER